MWREEDEFRKKAYEGLEKGDNVEDVGTSVLYADGQMLSLNLLGTEIWKRSDGKTIEEIVAELSGMFDVDPAVLREDVSSFLDDLKEKEYIYYEE